MCLCVGRRTCIHADCRSPDQPGDLAVIPTARSETGAEQGETGAEQGETGAEQRETGGFGPKGGLKPLTREEVLASAEVLCAA